MIGLKLFVGIAKEADVEMPNNVVAIVKAIIFLFIVILFLLVILFSYLVDAPRIKIIVEL